ncbi:hypothetical protein DHEL01_v211189 [Diaporthe helianthi]|uniref:FAD-binding PCMH-type domain-containing protein n=1 Tax=Diaporthe helianthi TaxID=158607 RepID=A0A2P5HJJ2_DIAHE|nr:hypothetical protein DHEL01_v211189 [Diaporthe helianthi]
MIMRDKGTVRLEAGTFNHEVINALWDQGYVTTTGACSCVGMAGPALGGGHGHLQGHHGLISDNLVSMRLVLANGTAITVDENTNVDLWWALRGAGHNFGVVTSFEMRIHPREGLERWYCRTYVFTHDKLERLFEELISFQEDSLPNTVVAGHFGGYAMDPTFSTTEAIISWVFVFSGSQNDAAPFLRPFDRLEPIATFDQSTMYPSLPDVLGSGLDSELCAASKAHIVSTTGLTAFNVTSQRQIYELYNKNVARHPSLRNARVLHEGYSTEAVRKVPAESSAYAFRDERLLMYFDAILEPGQEGLEEFTKQWAHETRDLWNKGQPERLSTTYVNYAFGDESVESLYGYEPWRLERLRALKAQYDPHNKFRYYNPIVSMTALNTKDEL